MGAIDGIISGIGQIIGDTVGKVIKDKDQAERLKADLNLAILTHTRGVISDQKEILLAEIGGDSKLARNWRPILMLVIVAIIANNYLLFPYLSLFASMAVKLELPSELWLTMQIGLGGYIGGRSLEKVAKTIQGAKGK